LPKGAAARLYNANGRPLPMLVRRALMGWLAETPLGESREFCSEIRYPERFLSLKRGAIIVAARSPRDAAESL
jgi:hypothetical protein